MEPKGQYLWFHYSDSDSDLSRRAWSRFQYYNMGDLLYLVTAHMDIYTTDCWMTYRRENLLSENQNALSNQAFNISMRLNIRPRGSKNVTVNIKVNAKQLVLFCKL